MTVKINGADDMYAHFGGGARYQRMLGEGRRPAAPKEVVTWLQARWGKWKAERQARELRRAVDLYHCLLEGAAFGKWKQHVVKAFGKTAKEQFKEAAEERAESQRKKDTRPAIVITPNEGSVVAKATAALVTNQESAGVFARGGQLVRVLCDADAAALARLIRREPGAPRIEVLPVPWVEVLLANVARWLIPREDKWTHAFPPNFAVRAIATAGRWDGMRNLAGVVQTPVLRADGTVLVQPGFDEKTGLMYLPADAIPPIPANPSIDDARRALAMLLDVVADFPFELDVHKAVWLVALLTPFARWAFDGPVPLFLIEATTRGTGKTLLAHVIGIITTGRMLACMTLPEDEDERRKRITALALAGDRIILVDNVDGVLGGAALNAALTSTTWMDRILGASKTTGALPLYAIWVVTGNNASLGTDTVRRTMPIRLASQMENPEERTGFAHPELTAWVREQRGQFVTAALTILAAYWAAGCPRQEIPAMGSYEEWSILRHLCVWLGLADPLLAQREASSRSDSDAGELRGILAGVEDLVGREWWTASGILKMLEQSDPPVEPDRGATLRSTLIEYCPGPGGELPKPKRFAGRLRHYLGRVQGGRYLASQPGSGGVAKWRVETVKGGEPGEDGGSRGCSGFVSAMCESGDISGGGVGSDHVSAAAGKAGGKPLQPPYPSGETPEGAPVAASANVSDPTAPFSLPAWLQAVTMPASAPAASVAATIPSKVIPAAVTRTTAVPLPIPLYELVTTHERAAEVCAELSAHQVLGFDIETYAAGDNTEDEAALDPFRSAVRLIQLAGDPGKAYLFDLQRLGSMPAPLRDLLIGPTLKAGHNLAFDAKMLLHHHGVEVTNLADTMAAPMLAEGYAGVGSNRRKGEPKTLYTLQAVVERYLDITLPKELATSDWSRVALSPEQLIYAARDATIALTSAAA